MAGFSFSISGVLQKPNGLKRKVRNVRRLLDGMAKLVSSAATKQHVLLAGGVCVCVCLCVSLYMRVFVHLEA